MEVQPDVVFEDSEQRYCVVEHDEFGYSDVDGELELLHDVEVDGRIDERHW